MNDTPFAVADQGIERRLHPWSWLFVLLGHLKQFAIPLLVLLFTGRGDRNELYSLIAVGILTLFSGLKYFTYRFRVEQDGLAIRSGILERSLRQIPFARIHNVSLHQSLLHRLFGVAEVRLESAGGVRPEAEMRVLRLSDALALEALVRHRGAAAAAHEQVPEDEVLLRLPVAEVIRLGLISNRGMVVVAAGFAALLQFNQQLMANLIERFGKLLLGWAGSHHYGPLQYAFGAIALLLLALLLMRALSVALALLQYGGFILRERERRLTVERGLFTRMRSSVTRRRIQAWALHEGVLHRLLRRRSLEVDTAVFETANDTRGIRHIAPVIAPDACDALIRRLLPNVRWGEQSWRALHPRAWRRLMVPGFVFALLLTAALSWRFGGWGVLGLLWLPWSAFVARQHARRAGYAIDDTLVAIRGGWWTRYWRFAEIDKLQGLRVTQSPFDRRHGMATLWLDTAGAAQFLPPLRIRYLPEPDAHALYAQLGSLLAQRRLQW